MNIRCLFLGFAMSGCMASSFAQIGRTTGPLTWGLENDTLTISGEGEMPDYRYRNPFENPAPWGISGGSTTTVIIENGVTSIGKYVFTFYNTITSVSIPNRVISIGNDAFGDRTALILTTDLNFVSIDISSNVFDGVNKSTGTLEVPINFVSVYKNANVWKEFNIVGIEVGSETIEKDASKIYHNSTSNQLKMLKFLIFMVKNNFKFKLTYSICWQTFILYGCKPARGR